MPLGRLLFCLTLVCSIINASRVNLYLTDGETQGSPQHGCLRVAARVERENDPHQIIAYCLTVWPLTWILQENTIDQKLEFAELIKLNITSEQLYQWSAPIDVVERYEFYRNEHSATGQSPLVVQWFYNCTSPRFGPFCEYSLDVEDAHHSSLNEIIYTFYENAYIPTRLTCYQHLKCNRGSAAACLHWTEICDGYIDCLNDGVDEKHCWELETNECAVDEYRCDNGQCIPKIFFHDDADSFECLDRSDEIRHMHAPVIIENSEPTLSREDITCPRRLLASTVRLTSSCVEGRDKLHQYALLSELPSTLTEKCWMAYRCLFSLTSPSDPMCELDSPFTAFKHILNESCPDTLFIPANPIAFGHIYLIFDKQTLLIDRFLRLPLYVCYHDQLCGGFYPNSSLMKFNNLTCRQPTDFPVSFFSRGRLIWTDFYVKPLYGQLQQCNTIIYDEAVLVCDKANLYQCLNSSKCISIHRRCDGLYDCDYEDDEECPIINGSCSGLGSNLLYKCITMNKCISLKRVEDQSCDCGFDEFGLCDDESADLDYVRKQISFPTICDGFTELKPVNIDGRNETDETECQHWQCSNTYTRCDGIWNCLNGADEANCDSSVSIRCPLRHHLCVSPITYQMYCLPIERANDGHTDCLGAMDEPTLCRSDTYQRIDDQFYCINDTISPCIHKSAICDNVIQCAHGDDEQFCDQSTIRRRSESVCNFEYQRMCSNAEKVVCERFPFRQKPQIVYFSLDGMEHVSTDSLSTLKTSPNSPVISFKNQHDHHCNRGFPLQVWLDSNRSSSQSACLCPPSFYGNECEYENERVSLTLKIQAYSDSRQTLFSFVVYLIDDSDQRRIHSHEQFTFLYVEHCQIKFNMYLFYSTRPKHLEKEYAIHIDIYEKVSFMYRGSLFIPLKYPFLSVNRVAFQLHIPRTSEIIESCSDLRCGHGRCVRYSFESKQRKSFCQCDREWFGASCHIPYNCTCSSDSLCVGLSTDNRSICVCPLNRWGPRCLMKSTICNISQNGTCLNGGQCISMAEHMIPSREFICLCKKGYSGKRCDLVDHLIVVTFAEEVSLPSSILVHFIRVVDNGPPENGSTFKTIPVNQRSVRIRWSRPFHIVFVELFVNNYYLVTVEKTYNRSGAISRTIHQSDRCEHLREILDETVANYHLLRRIKYYHLACQRSSPQLSCFYDDNHFCFCNDFGDARVANCFEFNPMIEHDCSGQSNCEHGARCLQDKASCPQTSVCVCPKCFYGNRCQFSSSLFGLSLDGILGSYLRPNIKLIDQPRFVIISVALTMIMVSVGLINGVLSLMTFKNDEPRQVGCGIYLLGSSITTLFTVVMFGLKLLILITAQMSNISNQSFLRVQCISIDFLLRLGLNMDQWLNACVATERAVTTVKGVKFSKLKSKQLSKYIIAALLLFNIATTIQDPLHRRLSDDNDGENEDKRIWCIISYPPHVQTFNLVMNIIHFSVPFSINIISAIIIIVLTARQRSTVQRDRTGHQLLRKQFQLHKHLLITPLVLVVLAVPRLILTLVSGCMKSTSEPWLFLIAYFVSFIPPMLTFMVFVLPSKWYKKEFYYTVRQYRQTIRRRLNLAQQ